MIIASTELFGMTTEAFEFIGYSEHRLKLLVHNFDKKILYCIFSIDPTHYLNKWMGVVIMDTPIRSGFKLHAYSLDFWTNLTLYAYALQYAVITK